MRARLCTSTESSTTAAMSSSRATARGQRPWRRGVHGGRFVSGDAHLRTVSEDNYEHRTGRKGETGALGAGLGRPPNPGFWLLPPPHLGPQLAPGGGAPPVWNSWQPPPPGFSPRRPPVYGPPPPVRNLWQPRSPRFANQRPPGYGPSRPPNSWQPPPLDFLSQPPRPRPQPADYRSWVPSLLPPPPPECERFKVLSYNILADYLAGDHQSKLYFHIPPEFLDWEWRKRRLLIEFGLWSPDIMCLQEVDRFQDLEEELTRRGYNGVWKMRTGNAVDGCAIFWRTNRFVLRHEEHIEFAKLGLRDNVAQICVLESRSQRPADDGFTALSARSNPSLRTDQVVVCNIHVLYNPKRGEIKLGQVRVLLDQAYSVSKIWNDAPVIICGDFNCTPKSPLYNFISGQKLSLSGLARNEISGQYSACIAPRPPSGSGLYRSNLPHENNNGKATCVEPGNHQIGIKHHHITQKNAENVSSVDSFSPVHVSDKLCSDGWLENEKRTELDVMAGVELDGLISPMCEEKDPSKETMTNIIEGSEVMTNVVGEGADNLTSTNASSQDDLHTVVEWQRDDKYLKNSFIIETLNREDEGVNCQQLAALGDRIMSHDALDSLSEENNISTIHTNCMLSTVQEGFIDFEMIKGTSNSYSDVQPPFEGDKHGFSPENDSKHILESKPESDNPPDDVILDVSSYQMVSMAYNASVGAPVPEIIVEPSTGLESGQEKADIDVSCQNSYKDEPLDSSNSLESHSDLEAVDLLVNEHIIKMKTARFDCEQVMADVPEKLPGVADATSQNIICHNRSQFSGSTASSRGVDTSEFGNSDTNGGEITSQSHSCLIDEGEGSSDSTFLEELHGMGNVYEFQGEVSVTSFSSQSMSLSFPDPLSGQSAGEERVKSDRLTSCISHQPQLESSKIEQKINDPFIWTPMEVQAASGNVECALLEHNLKLKSAYTEVEDYLGRKDSSREPQVTSYNRLFMGTVDYIWHSEGLQTVQVLATIPKHVLRRTSGFPTKKWGSDHLALGCEFAFKKDPQAADMSECSAV